MLRVLDSAGLTWSSPLAAPVMLPSAFLNNVGAPDYLISELNGSPACAPVNASPTALRPPAHDSGSG